RPPRPEHRVLRRRRRRGPRGAGAPGQFDAGAPARRRHLAAAVQPVAGDLPARRHAALRPLRRGNPRTRGRFRRDHGGGAMTDAKRGDDADFRSGGPLGPDSVRTPVTGGSSGGTSASGASASTSASGTSASTSASGTSASGAGAATGAVPESGPATEAVAFDPFADDEESQPATAAVPFDP